jgi:hypothetical protein
MGSLRLILSTAGQTRPSNWLKAGIAICRVWYNVLSRLKRLHCIGSTRCYDAPMHTVWDLASKHQLYVSSLFFYTRSAALSMLRLAGESHTPQRLGLFQKNTPANIRGEAHRWVTTSIVHNLVKPWSSTRKCYSGMETNSKEYRHESC